MKKVIVIAGPTASGKTALSIALANALGGEIVSADSMQIYRGMDIGTAKATAEEQAQAVHHMLDIADPDEDYSVARYVEDAAKCCEDILSRGKIPVITGGTGLYIDSLISGRDFARRDESDERLRQSLLDEYDTIGAEAMHARLREIDPERAAKLPAGDKRRICRAIEIFMLTGKTATEHDRETQLIPPRYDAARIYLNYKDRSDLYARIDRRVDMMMAESLENEVKALLERGISAECTAMQAIGYKEIVQALNGEMTMTEAVELIKQGSRRYAKRQLTWFRKDKTAFWVEHNSSPDMAEALRVSTEFLHSRDIS